MPGVLDNEQARRVSKSIDDDIKVGLTHYIRPYLITLSQREREMIKKRQKQRKEVKGVLPTPPLPSLSFFSCSVGVGLRLPLVTN
jgi:hypothetical protein